MFKQKLKTEEGSGLVLTLMVLLVLSVLGASLGVVTIGSNRLGHATQDSNSAYYIAEAGANMAYEEIEAYVLDAHENSEVQNSFFEKMNKPFGEHNNESSTVYEGFDIQFGDQPTATVYISPAGIYEESKEFIIKSVGEVSGKTRTVNKSFFVKWEGKGSSNDGLPMIPPNASIIARDLINFQGGTISGDIYLNAENESSFKIGWGTNFKGDSQKVYTGYKGSNKRSIYSGPSERLKGNDIIEPILIDTKLPFSDYNSVVESIEYPKYSDYTIVQDDEVKKNVHEKYDVIRNKNIYIDNYLTNGYVLELSENKRANKILISGDFNLKINTNNQIVNLVVNELNLSQGSIEIIDNGILNLYILNEFNIGGNSVINKTGDQGRFNLFYAGGKDITVSGSQFIKGGMHIAQADLALTGSGNVAGPILSNGKNVYVSGGSLNDIFVLAPKANVNLSGSGIINGVVIANKLELEGDPKINYREYNYENFPFGFKSNNNRPTPNINDLISTDPAIEK